mmetsp:Transcript_27361/g.52092  ORF Transcript_27361/g.52092 Transcript_27361/m.52092 type:complete len:502 (-) Transcript_27361:81-1586(-)|eukprot:CAMPEP_0114246842 /NCGR_PEP_ID=MMETSP0058-20121206/12694_1 /TAXON_ID=36894 /ORGANISM="Pyramimonas parkeae, CCMP726" /LENGTH=501 /DNA_ID=CAMNT_0001360087 /DNA_START=226 /DNA_END=1731 /DNA_ORIENTATION=-
MMKQRLLKDHFTLDKELGSGGFSTVRLGIKKSNGVQVAVKTLEKSSRGCSGDFALIRSEITIMAYLLEHAKETQHVIRMLDVFDEPQAVHLVLEVCKGGELFDRIIDKGYYSEQDAAKCIKQIATGLRDLHKLGILHRDLKPENILFMSKAEDADLKIMDFGLAHLKGTEDAMVGLFGSLDYIAPEALTKREYCAQTDTWAVGVILYILLCGYPPFFAEDTKEKQMLIVQGKYDFDEPIWKNVSEGAKDLIQGLMVVDPANRMSAAQILDHPWVKNLDQDSTAPLPGSVRDGISSMSGKRKFRVAAYAAVCMARQMRKLHNTMSVFSGKKKLSQQELTRLHQEFSKVSSKAEDGISFEKFQQVLASLNITMPNMKRVFQLFDSNKDGTVDMRELICGLTSLREQPTTASALNNEETLKFCFDVYDLNGDGTLSRDEVTHMLKMVIKDDPGTLQAEALGDVFEELDQNGDGEISFDEFKHAITDKPYLVKGILDPVTSATLQ